MKMKFKKRISITGPESSGKSWLSQQLSLHYKTPLVEEYSREYLDEKTTYKKDDILKIAKGQLENENKMADSNLSILFCDTDVLVNKIWEKYVFDKCNNWVEINFLDHQYGLYLLCYPDIKWEFDPLRENPDNRLLLFEMYETELKKAGFNYKIIKGQGNERLKNAVNFVDDYLLKLKAE